MSVLTYRCPKRAGAYMIEHSSFSPEHEKAIMVAFEDCLRALGLTDRPSDRAVLVIARRIIELAKQGECNPAMLQDGALRSVKRSKFWTYEAADRPTRTSC